jgi:transposase
MGRLSTYAKNRILNLRFQKHNKITQIVKALVKEDIKVSRQSVSTFLKRYLETDSIHDKPRTGRKRKLTNDEIQLIGEITRLNRDITARAIKDHLNLNVSTYTILRATKLFEWNKLNPNSNEAKKQAAVERQMRGEVKRRKVYPKKSKKESSDQMNDSDGDIIEFPACLQLINVNQLNNTTTDLVQLKNPDELYDLNLVTEREVQIFKNTACSPMSFATKILFKIYSINELHGHNVSGKTFNKNVGHKEPLEEKRLMYIRWLVEKSFSDENTNKEQLWKACCNAINKMIRRSEVNAQKLNGSPGKLPISKKPEDGQSTASANIQVITINSNMEQFNSSNLDESMNFDDDDEDDDFVEIEKQQPRRQVEQRQLLQQQQQQQQEERVVIQEGLDDEPSEALNTSSEYEFKQDIDTDSESLNTSNNSFVVVAAAHQPKRLRNKKVF